MQGVEFGVRGVGFGVWRPLVGFGAGGSPLERGAHARHRMPPSEDSPQDLTIKHTQNRLGPEAGVVCHAYGELFWGVEFRSGQRQITK